MPRIKQSIETDIINETGELISKRANRTLSWGDEPKYIKLYLADIMYLADMPKRLTALTYSLLKRVSYAGDEDGMCVTLVPRTKRNILKELGWKNMQSLDNALSELCKGLILERVDTGMYRFNPFLFGRGDWQDISRLRLEVEYSYENDIFNRTFGAHIDYKDKDENEAETDEKKGA